jgi:hypothetical protein
MEFVDYSTKNEDPDYFNFPENPLIVYYLGFLKIN